MLMIMLIMKEMKLNVAVGSMMMMMMKVTMIKFIG